LFDLIFWVMKKAGLVGNRIENDNKFALKEQIKE
jgi:hypothetical protein